MTYARVDVFAVDLLVGVSADDTLTESLVLTGCLIVELRQVPSALTGVVLSPTLPINER